MKLKLLFSALAMALLAGCAAMPTQQEIAALDYGTPVPDNYKTQISVYLQVTLKDPYSAHIDIQEPIKYWYQEPLLSGGKRHVGWLVKVFVNAKNSFGGYTGSQTYGFLFRNDVIDVIISPDEWAMMRTH